MNIQRSLSVHEDHFPLCSATRPFELRHVVIATEASFRQFPFNDGNLLSLQCRVETPWTDKKEAGFAHCEPFSSIRMG